MNSQNVGKNRINTVLILFVLLNIIGDVCNVIFWYASPSSQSSLVGGTVAGVASNGGYIASWVGADAALAAGTIILLAVSVVYIAALFGLLRRRTWAPLLASYLPLLRQRNLKLGLAEERR